MAITIKHAKTDTIADWTQTDLDAQIALGNFPPGTTLADIVLPSDWNDDHTFTGTLGVSNGGTGATTLTGYVKGNGTSAFTASSTIPNTDVSGLGTMATQNANNVTITGGSISGTTVSGYIPTTEKGVANGVATLDSGGQVPVSQIPALGDLNYQGTWDASTNSPTLTSSVGTKGYYYVVNVAGTTNLNGITDWQVGDWAVYNGSAWQKIDNTDAVTSVNGYTGTVVLNYSDVGAFPATSTTGSGNVVLATGATQSHPTISDYESFTPTTAPSYAEGELWYDSTSHALAYYNDVSSAIVHIGQDLQVKVINNTGSTIANGSPVYITSTSSGQTYPNIALAKADVAATSAVIGLTNGSIANGAVGYVTAQGGIDGVNTGSFTVGQVLYLSPYSAGQLMNTIPPTGITVQVGVVSYVNSSTGKIYVKQTTPLAVPASIITGTLGVDHGGTGQASALVAGGVMYGSSTTAMGVTAVGTSGQVLTSSGAGAPTWTTPTTGTVTSVTGTAPIASTGGATPAISISQATTSTNGYLSSTDWNTFNNKQPAGTYVTSVSATSPVTSSGGTTPTIAMPAATTSVSGYLTSTDWNTFNNKGSGTVTSVSVVSANGLAGTSSGGATPALTLSTTVTGLLKGNGTAISAATSGTDYAPATSGTSILYGNGSGGFSNVTIGSGVSFAGGTLSATGSGGTVTSVTGTAPIVSSGGTTPSISMAAATGSVNGYLTSTDWTTFNNKAPSVTYTSTYVPYGQGTTTPALSSSFTYNSSTGVLTAPEVNASNGIVVNSKTVSTSYSIPSGSSAMSAGPITVASGVTVTIASGSRWVVL